MRINFKNHKLIKFTKQEKNLIYEIVQYNQIRTINAKQVLYSVLRKSIHLNDNNLKKIITRYYQENFYFVYSYERKRIKFIANNKNTLEYKLFKSNESYLKPKNNKVINNVYTIINII